MARPYQHRQGRWHEAGDLYSRLLPRHGACGAHYVANPSMLGGFCRLPEASQLVMGDPTGGVAESAPRSARASPVQPGSKQPDTGSGLQPRQGHVVPGWPGPAPPAWREASPLD